MGNIPSYLQPPSVFTQCIRKRKTSYSQQLIDIDSDYGKAALFEYDFGDEEIIYKLEKKKNTAHTLNDHQIFISLKRYKKHFFYQVLFFLFAYGFAASRFTCSFTFKMSVRHRMNFIRTHNPLVIIAA